MGILKWFKQVSGLNINKEKTNVDTIGTSRGRSIPWQDKFSFKWAKTFEILGIYYNINKIKEITALNVHRKMGEIKKLIFTWQSRNLIPDDKLTILNHCDYQNLPLYLCFFLALNFLCFKEISNTFSNFSWYGKPPKCRKEILEGNIYHVGLKLYNIKRFYKTHTLLG